MSADATRDQVTRAFRALARRYHPDSGAGDPAAFARIRDAYEKLRARERSGSRGSSPRRSAPASGVPIPVRVTTPTPRRGSDISAAVELDLEQAVFGTTVMVDRGRHGPAAVRIPPGVPHRHRVRVVGSGRPGRHGGPAGDLMVTVLVAEHPTYRRVGADLSATLTISYPEAVLGATVPVTTLSGAEVDVTVPPGTAPGHRLRVPGHGVPGQGRRPTGDLVLEIQVHIPQELGADQRATLQRLAELLPPPPRDPRGHRPGH
ncbi:hypothetical protein GCM10009799_07530 [Nocardiopsis rhodophaea]|uniref:J domain-containing protein n=1 Tax=Nocardiopsis rhodophaea TaxID=280238 RepID=A0ABP5DRS9_9ACTN